MFQRELAARFEKFEIDGGVFRTGNS